ncbi:unnamed protein product [Adineta ricciae]|uniref:Uncharacterized protein n=1 Tax=Adineta ricciae TaxID=249248 RepID=A0A814FZ48_ADIRI|nr:unnamed protein product [Adineta ricciae]
MYLTSTKKKKFAMPFILLNQYKNNMLEKRKIEIEWRFTKKQEISHHDRFIPTHDATIFDTYVADIQVDGKTIDLALFDTAGQEDYDRLRPLSYPDTSVVLICFSVDSPVSATSVLEKWIPEVRHFCGTCPVILVACKKDLRTDPEVIAKLKQEGEKPVTSETGREIAARIKADAYMECSAKTRDGVQDLFVHAARLSLKQRSVDVQVNEKTVNLVIFDTAGQEDYARIRALSYADTNIVLVCFSVDSPLSAMSVIENWMPEVREFCGRCPVILVACKTDLRTDNQTIELLQREDETPVTTETGKQIAARIKAYAYMECSARTGEGVQELFQCAAQLTCKKHFRKSSDQRCALL